MFSWFRDLFIKLIKAFGNFIVDALEWVLKVIRKFIVEVVDTVFGWLFDILPDGTLAMLGDSSSGLSNWDLVKLYAESNLGFVGWLFPISDVIQIVTAAYLIVGTVRFLRWCLAAIPFSWFKVS